MVWLEYQYRDTFIHRLNPLTRLVVTASVMLLAGTYLDPVIIAPMFLFALAWCLVAKVPVSWFKIYIVIIFTSFPFQILTAFLQRSPELYKVIPPEIATRGMFSVTLPIIGQMVLTYGGTVWVVGHWARMFTGLLMAYALAYTTSVTDIINVMALFHTPSPVLFMMTVCYKFVPQMLRVLNTITEAQTLRGWEAKSRNPLKTVRKLAPLMTPLMRRTGVITEEVAISAQIRAFGAGKVTLTERLSPTIKDYAICTLSLGTLAIGICLMLFYKFGLI